MNKIAGKEDIMQNVYEKLISCYESIREKIPFTPRVALAVSYTHLRAHETDSYLVCRLLLEKKKCKALPDGKNCLHF